MDVSCCLMDMIFVIKLPRYCMNVKFLIVDRRITSKGTSIALLSREGEDYICITDIARFKDVERTDYLIPEQINNSILIPSNSMGLQSGRTEQFRHYDQSGGLKQPVPEAFWPRRGAL